MKTYKLIEAIKKAINSDDAPPTDTRILMYEGSSTVNEFLIALTGYGFETLKERIKNDNSNISDD
jgi:hypothetical protein